MASKQVSLKCVKYNLSTPYIYLFFLPNTMHYSTCIVENAGKTITYCKHQTLHSSL